MSRNRLPGPVFNAIVLAADRASGDPVAAMAGLSHKCMVPVAGVPMLQRVLETLLASPWIGQIAVSLRDPGILDTLDDLAPALADGTIRPIDAAGSPSLSVLEAARAFANPYPLLVTTADHALLNLEMVDHFCSGSSAANADVCAALTPGSLLQERYPESRRTFLNFRNECYSGANLFAFLTPKGLDAAIFWRRVEQQRKRPWRMAGIFGPGLLLRYLLRRDDLERFMARVSQRLGLAAHAIEMPFAEAAIDVDKPEDLKLVEKILARANR